MSTTLFLVCIFGISPVSPGTKQTHVMTHAEVITVSRILNTYRADEDPEAVYSREGKYLDSLCKLHFGKTPNLSWTKGGAL